MVCIAQSPTPQPHLYTEPFTSTPLNSFRRNWSTDCTPELLTQHQHLTLLMLLWLKEHKSLQPTFGRKAIAKEYLEWYIVYVCVHLTSIMAAKSVWGRSFYEWQYEWEYIIVAWLSATLQELNVFLQGPLDHTFSVDCRKYINLACLRPKPTCNRPALKGNRVAFYGSFKSHSGCPFSPANGYRDFTLVVNFNKPKDPPCCWLLVWLVTLIVNFCGPWVKLNDPVSPDPQS